MRRHLLLTGFMGTGKTTVGARVAARTGAPFVDLDALIEQRTGTTVAEWFELRGEREFRAAEGDVLRSVLASDAVQVVALGGGSLLERATRLDALDRAVVVALSAGAATLYERTRAQPERPLLRGADPAARIGELLLHRRVAYAEAHARVDTDGRDLDSIAAEIEHVWRRDPLVVAAGEASYRIEVGADLAAEGAGSLARGARVVILVSDENVAPLHAAPVCALLEAGGARVSLVVLRAGEQHKTIDALEPIWRAALAAGADRGARFVALGGGVVSDVTGFAAATYMRGVRWAVLPTTLLAMVDAAVGGKTAVDLGGAKNIVGAFWQPLGVRCDVNLLRTEPARGYVSGLAEVVKTALVGDAGLLDQVEERAAALLARDPELVAEVVWRCVRVKARVVSVDERESGPRATLNLGHTLGHALEAEAGFGALTHGEAVSLGLVAALRLGARRGVTDGALVTRVTRLLVSLGLPTTLRAASLSSAARWLAHDKKRAGGDVRFVFVRQAGDTVIEPIAIAELERELSGVASD